MSTNLYGTVHGIMHDIYMLGQHTKHNWHNIIKSNLLNNLEEKTKFI